MASAQAANLTSAVTQRWIKKVSDSVTENIPLLHLIERSGGLEFNKTGRVFEARTRVSEFTSIVGFDATTELAFQDESLTLSPEYPVRGLAGSCVVYKADEIAAGGPEKIWDLRASKMQWLAEDLNETLETDLNSDGATGTRSGKTVVGITAFISTSNTYAGLSQTTNATWAASTQSGAGYQVDPCNILRQAQRAVQKWGQKGGNDSRLTHFQMSADDFTYLENSFADKQRVAADNKMLEAGFDNIRVGGAVCYWSPKNTANTIYGLNLKRLLFWCQPNQLWVKDEEKSISPWGFKLAVFGRFNLLCLAPRYFCLVSNTNT